MASATLVAYATRYGSTEDVARAIWDRLREQGVTAEVLRARRVRSVKGYNAVVLATPFYFGSMLKEARTFLERHRAPVEAVPLAILALGPVSACDEPAEARAQLDGVLARMPWLRPQAAAMFVGRYDPARLGPFHRLIAALPASPLRGVPARDDRDWGAIKAWVDALPAVFRQTG